MKKLFVGAAIVVAGLASAKNSVESKVETKPKTEFKAEAKTEAKLEVKYVKQTCGVQITYYSGGQVVGSQLVTSEQETLSDCQKWQNGVRFALQIAGYWTVG
ncbi:hypothetical protein [Chryseobacterium sp.]|uniref:hypothetical protein n=1 Tax=Chryseobacterium sp. TaxID=1871047 RepID=UPI002FC7581E